MRRKIIYALLIVCVLSMGNISPVLGSEFTDIPEVSTDSVEEDLQGEEALSNPLFSDGAGGFDLPAFDDGAGEDGQILAEGEEDQGSEGLVYAYVEETDSYIVVKGVDVDTVHIPATYEGKPVTEIAAGAFKDFDEVHKVFLGKSGVTIHTGAFQNCSSLIFVGTKGCVNIESRAFTECHKLFTISWLDCQLQKSCTIASDAFDMESKVIIWSYGDIDDGASFLALDMESYYEDIIDGVSYVESWLFGDQMNDIGTIITNFDNSCSTVNLRSEGFDPGIIYRKAFYGCDRLEELTLNPEMQYIQTKAFANCINLRKIYIPSSVKEIADDAFSGCTKVTITGMPGSYAETYARSHDIPFEAAVSAPGITNVTVNKNMVTIELSDFYGDMYYCVAGTNLKNGVPVRNKNGRIATYQTGNKVVFRNLGKDVYYIGARALSLNGTEKTYSGWSNIVRVDIQADTPARPEISSVSVSGRNIRFKAALPEGASGYDVMLSRGTKKNDSSTAGVAIPAANKAVYGRSNPANGTNVTTTIRNVKSGTYYLGIQAYSILDGQKIYSQWSPLKKIRI